MKDPIVAAPADPLKPNGFNANGGISPPTVPVVAPEAPAPSSVPAIASLMNETDTDPGTEVNSHLSIPVAESIDPAVQQPTSDLRSTTEPATAERASEIKEAKQQSDLVSDREMAAGLTEPGNAPIERTLTPAPELPPINPEASPVVEQANATGASRELPPTELPHRSPAVAPLAEPVEPVPTPAITAPMPEVLSEPAIPPAQQLAPDVDHTMTDAPSPGKVRPREEEEEDEPATKRLKSDLESPPATDVEMVEAPAETVPAAPVAPVPAEIKAPTPSAEETPTAEPPKGESAKPEHTPAPVEATPATTETAVPTEASMPAPATSAPVPAVAWTRPPYVRKSGNPDFDKPITQPQKKILQKIVTNVKRGQHAPAFKEPVNPVALGIPTYFDVVKNPMDLSTMESKAKNGEYHTVNEFIADFDQIVLNCEMFNGLSHEITRHAHELGKSFEKQLQQIPTTDFVEPPPPERKKAGERMPAEPRASRRESRPSFGAAPAAPPTPSGGGTAKSPTAGSPASPAFALKEGGLPQIRRGSEVAADRPRREIHPPAPKDLPYAAQKPRKKKYAAELRFCQKILNDLMSSKYHASNWPFLAPVDPVAMNLPTYRKIIKKPMDLGTMQSKLKTNEYEDAKEFEADMRLVIGNCFKFNPEGDTVHRAGKGLETLFEDMWSEKREWLKKNAPKSGGGTPQSASEEDDSDDADEAEESDDEGAGNSTTISQLEQQILEMSRNLEKMRKGSDANKKKARAKSIDAGKAGATKKKKAGGAAKPEKKKATKPKKQDYVTYEQKQDISERINTLPPQQMNQALKVIRDNMPNLKVRLPRSSPSPHANPLLRARRKTRSSSTSTSSPTTSSTSCSPLCASTPRAPRIRCRRVRRRAPPRRPSPRRTSRWARSSRRRAFASSRRSWRVVRR